MDKLATVGVLTVVLLINWVPVFATCPPVPPSSANDAAAAPFAQIRLYNFRHASLIAGQLSSTFPLLHIASASSASADGGKGSSEIPDDLLIVVSKDEADPLKAADSISELRRVVAFLDLPRPQVTLQAWSIKISSKDPYEIDKSVKRLQQNIEELNLRIQKALKFGWFDLMMKAQSPGFLNADFREYVSRPFIINQAKRPEKYSLGYIHAFSPDQPSIATMLLCLTASEDPRKWIDDVVDRMEEAATESETPQRPNNGTSKESPPSISQKSEGASSTEPRLFAGFRAYLHALADPQETKSPSTTGVSSSETWVPAEGRQSALRAALADFLYQYKWATLYPHDFVGYDLQNSATVLDSLFAPAVDALNHDIQGQVKRIIQQEEELSRKDKKTQLSSRGLITVAAISGHEATVAGKTISHFDVTKAPTLAEMVQGMESAKTNLSALFPQVTGNAALIASALAAVSAQEKTFVKIEKGMNLVITPNTLPTAASAELDINLDGGDENGKPADDSDPSLVGAKTDQSYTVDRISKHSVNTRVRVDSLKLFEVSTFAFDLMHPRPDGVVPVVGQVWQGVFGAVPGAGRLFTWHRPPDISAHRSLILISALIVPTSIDLALGIRVESDRQLQTSSSGEMEARTLHAIDDDPLLRKVRPFHKKKLECMLSPEQWVVFPKTECKCSNISFECVAADIR